jgi:hypothetical protein
MSTLTRGVPRASLIAMEIGHLLGLRESLVVLWGESVMLHLFLTNLSHKGVKAMKAFK